MNWNWKSQQESNNTTSDIIGELECDLFHIENVKDKAVNVQSSTSTTTIMRKKGFNNNSNANERYQQHSARGSNKDNFDETKGNMSRSTANTSHNYGPTTTLLSAMTTQTTRKNDSQQQQQQQKQNLSSLRAKMMSANRRESDTSMGSARSNNGKSKSQRNMTISAKPLQLSSRDFVMPSYPKTQEQVQFIDKCLISNFIFASLTKSERRSLIYAMKLHTCSANTIIIKQGDTINSSNGNNNNVNDQQQMYFYVVESGDISFIVDGNNVGSCTKGASFGELALLYNCPRAATCIAKTPCRLWKVDQLTFKHMLANNEKHHKQDINNTMRKVPFLSNIDEKIIDHISNSLTTTVTYPKDTYIINKNYCQEPIFYIIMDGTVIITDIGSTTSRNGEQHQEEERGKRKKTKTKNEMNANSNSKCHYVTQKLYPGDYFGERSIMTGESHMGNVIVTSEWCTCLCISYKTFHSLILNPSLSKNNIKKDYDDDDYDFNNRNNSNNDNNDNNGNIIELIDESINKRLLSSIPIFANLHLSNDNIEKLCKLLKIEYFDQNEMFVTSEQSLFVIKSGKMSITTTQQQNDDQEREEEETTCMLYNSGDYFGSDTLIYKSENDVNERTIEALEDTICYVLTKSDIISIIGHYSIGIDERRHRSGCGSSSLMSSSTVSSSSSSCHGSKERRNNNNNDKIRLKDLTKHRIMRLATLGKVWLVSCNNSRKNDKKKRKKDNKNDQSSSSSLQQQKEATYSLKIFDKHELMDKHQVDAALRERCIMAEIKNGNHPFLVNFISSFQDKTSCYIVTQFAQGGELYSLIHNSNTNNNNEMIESNINATTATTTDDHHGQHNLYPNFDIKNHAKFYAACIVEALSYLHQHNIIYRNLKPESILIGNDGYCVLVDFGFAKVVTDKTYTLCGTPEYMSPEIIISKGHNKGVDYWALGCIIYEMIIGHSPFFNVQQTQLELFKRIIQVEYNFPLKAIGRKNSLQHTNNNCHEAAEKNSVGVNIEDNRKAKDLIRHLLVSDQSHRYGCMTTASTVNKGNNGVNECGGYYASGDGANMIRNHSWFTNDINFDMLINKEIVAPWTPQIQDGLDSSHYDTYDDDDDDNDDNNNDKENNNNDSKDIGINENNASINENNNNKTSVGGGGSSIITSATTMTSKSSSSTKISKQKQKHECHLLAQHQTLFKDF